MEDLIESSCEIGLLVNVGRKFYTRECSELGQDNDGQIISSINVIVLFASFCACLFFFSLVFQRSLKCCDLVEVVCYLLCNSYLFHSIVNSILSLHPGDFHFHLKKISHVFPLTISEEMRGC